MSVYALQTQRKSCYAASRQARGDLDLFQPLSCYVRMRIARMLQRESSVSKNHLDEATVQCNTAMAKIAQLT